MRNCEAQYQMIGNLEEDSQHLRNKKSQLLDEAISKTWIRTDSLIRMDAHKLPWIDLRSNMIT